MRGFDKINIFIANKKYPSMKLNDVVAFSELSILQIFVCWSAQDEKHTCAKKAMKSGGLGMATFWTASAGKVRRLLTHTFSKNASALLNIQQYLLISFLHFFVACQSV